MPLLITALDPTTIHTVAAFMPPEDLDGRENLLGSSWMLQAFDALSAYFFALLSSSFNRVAVTEGCQASLTDHIPRPNRSNAETPAPLHPVQGEGAKGGSSQLRKRKSPNNPNNAPLSKRQKSQGLGYKLQDVTCLHLKGLPSEMCCLDCIQNESQMPSESPFAPCHFIHFHWFKIKGSDEYWFHFRDSPMKPEHFEYHDRNPPQTPEYMHKIWVSLVCTCHSCLNS
jgi:hypothetical protein